MKQPPAITPAPTHVAIPDPTSQARHERRGIPKRRVALSCALLAGIAGCAAHGGGIRPLVSDQAAMIEGRLASVDMAPMAYDGDALLVVTTDAHGAVTVHLPARRHLCQAQGLELLEALKPGQRLQVAGTATGPRDIRVCQDASHRLQRLP